MNNTSSTKIFVGGLAADVDEEKLSEFFSQFGTVTESLIMKDGVSQRPRGFGFVTFETEDGKNEALKNRFYFMGEKKVEVKAAVPRDKVGLDGGRGVHGGGMRGGYHQGGYGPRYSGGDRYGGHHLEGPGSYAGGPYGGYGGSQGYGGYPPQGGYGGPGPMDSSRGISYGAPSHGWSVHSAPDGTPYYYNERTGVSSWDVPPEMRGNMPKY